MNSASIACKVDDRIDQSGDADEDRNSHEDDELNSWCTAWWKNAVDPEDQDGVYESRRDSVYCTDRYDDARTQRNGGVLESVNLDTKGAMRSCTYDRHIEDKPPRIY